MERTHARTEGGHIRDMAAPGKIKRHTLMFNAPISVPSPHLLTSKKGANQRINSQIALEGLQIEMFTIH